MLIFHGAFLKLAEACEDADACKNPSDVEITDNVPKKPTNATLARAPGQ
jgi:hypothetical protein